MAEEVTSKTIINQTKRWFKFFLSKWLLLLIAGLAGSTAAVIFVLNQKPTYDGSLSFILSNNTTNNTGLYGLASQFGIDLSSNTDVFSGDNIISFMNSRTMVQKALLQKPPNSNETLLNIFSSDTKLNKEWEKNKRTSNSYPFPDDTAKMNYVQDSLFRDVYKTVIDKYLSVSKPDKNIEVYVVTTKSHNEIFSLYLTKFLVEATSKFYIDTKTKLARDNLKMLQHEADSIYSILTKSVSSSARNYDYTFNLNPAYSTQRVPAQEAQLSGTALGTAYGEVLRNLELAKINLQKETPLYQIIDEPQLPLVAQKTSVVLAFIVGGFIGVVLMMIAIALKKISW